MRREDLDSVLRAGLVETLEEATRFELARWWYRLGQPGRDPEQSPARGDRIRCSQRGVASPWIEVTSVEPHFDHEWGGSGVVTYRRVNKAGKVWGRFLSRPLTPGKPGQRWGWIGGWGKGEVVAHAGWLCSERS